MVILLVGARWIRSADERGSPAGNVAFAAEESDATGGAPAVSGSGDVVVHVAGAVRDPGVYRLPDGSRVTDAIQRAGGPTPAAAPDGLNLAARVADGQQVLLPARASEGAVAAAGAPTSDGPIGLGSATLEELDTIEGIGPITAQDILNFRDEQGGLSSIEELDEVSGIRPATIEALRDRLQP